MKNEIQPPLRQTDVVRSAYRNSFYNKNYSDSREIIETEAKPIEYKGYLLYHRIKGVVVDLVKNGVCVGMCQTFEGAKRRIDLHIKNPQNDWI